MRHTTTSFDEEASPPRLTAAERRRLGAFFTPARVVDQALRAVAPFVPSGPLTVVDPACGPGAFLQGASQLFPHARLVGLELEPRHAAQCREQVPGARIEEGNALVGDALERLLPQSGFELWVGNPPYNGTSSVLKDPAAYDQLKALFDRELPRGQSLRDDFAFFLLRAAARLEGRAGALVFVTSSTLLDAFLYAPLRRALLERLTLREVIDLGPGVFEGTRVSTCIAVWTTPRSRAGAPKFGRQRLRPCAPEWRLRPVDTRAEALHQRWTEHGEPLGTLVPVSLPGLKTRFDELLVDDDRERLLARVAAFFAAGPADLQHFAEHWDIPPGGLGKLEALQRAVPPKAAVDPSAVHRFHRHRGPPGWCYLDRALIPRGDHRLQGSWNPHRCDVKLVFNTHEWPLWASVLDTPGCVTAYRHSRFAPLLVPEQVLQGGPAAARRAAHLGPLVTNLSARGREAGPAREVFSAIARFIMSEPVQRVWGPAFGTTRALPVPFEALRAASPQGRP